MTQAIPVDCLHVFHHISNYLEDDVDPAVRARMEAHFKVCAHCTAVLDGTRNLLRLVGDGRAFDLPPGFSRRLYHKLSAHLKRPAPARKPSSRRSSRRRRR